MFSMNFINSVFLIQCTIIYNQYEFVMSLIGPAVRQAEPNEFPAVVSIVPNNFNPEQIEDFHHCTGTLVSRQDVITAEHCIRAISEEPFQTLLGSYDLHNSIVFSYMYIWPYISWATYREVTIAEGDHDIVFVKLIGNVPDTIELAIISNVQNQMFVGMDAMIVGWGRINNGSIPRYLQTVPVKILSKSDCEHHISMVGGYEAHIAANDLCTMADPYGLLNGGDSGGPLLFFGVLIGINIGICPPARGDMEIYHVNIHVGIDYYRQFVQDMLITFHINF